MNLQWGFLFTIYKLYTSLPKKKNILTSLINHSWIIIRKMYVSNFSTYVFSLHKTPYACECTWAVRAVCVILCLWFQFTLYLAVPKSRTIRATSKPSFGFWLGLVSRPAIFCNSHGFLANIVSCMPLHSSPYCYCITPPPSSNNTTKPQYSK